MNRKEQIEQSKNATAKGLKKKFPNSNKKQIKWMIKNSGKLVKMYNSFCHDCKKLANENPSRPADDYCSKCQKIAKEVIEQ